ncbi:ankyrin repeat-containing domain protein [Aspergillus minisclerotigenes]|uniref:Ankyrin repeat-containing domain protein n=1 Tax=Aspergillus minisclerotigenes TaxID=656917 RepID=A0A5N6JKE1_9EURO|nr:ankyrin repeat-containing domain protein [Aspergillus minisclerotigenes]
MAHGTGLTILSIAAGFCSANVVRRVVDIIRDRVGNTGDIFSPADNVLILHRAISKGDAESVRILLENGADPSGWDIHGVSALTLATASGNEEIVTMLLDWGANRLPHDAVERSALACAASSTKLSWKTVERIFHAYRNAGGDINCTYVTIPEFVGGAPRPLQTLPLHQFAAAGSVPGIELLLRYGAKVSTKGRNGMTALHAALFRYRYNRDTYQNIDEICQVLVHAAVRLGEDLNTQLTSYSSFMPMRGTTALHLAVVCELEEIVRLLLVNGADVKIVDEEGKTAVDLAKGLGNQPITDLLTAKHNGATTSFLPNCTASATATTTASTSTATGGFSNGLVNCEMTIVSGPKTFYVAYEGETVERFDMDDKSATGYVTWTTTSGTSTIGTSVESSVVPVTSAAFTITGTAASVTPSASASASAKASVSGSANATSTSASASASHTENAAMGLPTGHSLFAAGGAAMALALAIA